MSCVGRDAQIRGASAKVASDQWHTLSLKAVGDQFTIGFDDKTLFSAADQTFPNAGKIALWTKADSVTRFDNLTIRRWPSRERAKRRIQENGGDYAFTNATSSHG